MRLVAIATLLAATLAAPMPAPEQSANVLPGSSLLLSHAASQCEIDIESVEVVQHWQPLSGGAPAWVNAAEIELEQVTITRQGHKFYVKDTAEALLLGVYCTDKPVPPIVQGPGPAIVEDGIDPTESKQHVDRRDVVPKGKEAYQLPEPLAGDKPLCAWWTLGIVTKTTEVADDGSGGAKYLWHACTKLRELAREHAGIHSYPPDLKPDKEHRDKRDMTHVDEHERHDEDEHKDEHEPYRPVFDNVP